MKLYTSVNKTSTIRSEVWENSVNNPEAKRARTETTLAALERVHLASFLTQLKQHMITQNSGSNGAQSVAELHQVPQTSKPECVDSVLDLLQRLTLHQEDWSRHVYFDSDSYTRTLVRKVG